MEKKIIVPNGMARAAYDAMDAHARVHGPAVGCKPGSMCSLTVGLEAAIRWLDKMLECMCQRNHYEGRLSSHAAMIEIWREGILEVRRVFLAPEPEVPEEIAQMLVTNGHPVRVDADTFNAAIKEAYRRGQKAKK